uniref:Uncharacterized protein n=1 Tax=Oryza sativa subsp. japonica TaxID=39947 RepID=Q9FWL6_ORYSJ|nr:hypothetical protein [Oryza sativa Japonica Group]
MGVVGWGCCGLGIWSARRVAVGACFTRHSDSDGPAGSTIASIGATTAAAARDGRDPRSAASETEADADASAK